MATLGERLQCRQEMSNPCNPYAVAVAASTDMCEGGMTLDKGPLGFSSTGSHIEKNYIETSYWDMMFEPKLEIIF